MNLHLPQQMMGRFQFTDLRDSVTTRSICLPAKRSGRVSVHCWGWICHEGGGILHHIEGHLDGLQYQHILQNVMVPSVRILYPEGIIHLQQDHSSIHDCCVVQEWLSRQADVELLDWPPQAPDMNPIENMWSEVKRTMQET